MDLEFGGSGERNEKRTICFTMKMKGKRRKIERERKKRRHVSESRKGQNEKRFREGNEEKRVKRVKSEEDEGEEDMLMVLDKCLNHTIQVQVAGS